MDDIVIVGAGMAGQRAAVGLRGAGFAGRITMVGEEGLMPYDRPPLTKSAITDDDEPQPTWLMAEDVAASLSVTVTRGVGAVAIDCEDMFLSLANGKRLAYGKLLLATGAKPRRLTLPGGEHARALRNFEDSVALRHSFTPGRRIAIIGAGFIGLELAAAARKRGCEVTVIESQPRILMRGVAEPVARIVDARHRAAGVALRTGTGIAALTAASVELASGESIPADTIVAGIGAAPDIRLAESGGLAIDNGIAADATLCTSDAGIYAAGDCCSFPHPLYGGQRIRLEAWRNAQDQGSLVAENLLGAGKAYRAVPWFWSDQFDVSLQVAGLPGFGSEVVERRLGADSLLTFHLDTGGRLVAACGIGPGNAVARDIKLAEMMIAKSAMPSTAQLADPAVPLKPLALG